MSRQLPNEDEQKDSKSIKKFSLGCDQQIYSASVRNGLWVQITLNIQSEPLEGMHQPIKSRGKKSHATVSLIHIIKIKFTSNILHQT